MFKRYLSNPGKVYLDGFDYASYLKRKLLVGQVDPWKLSENNKPLYTTLVTIDMALTECAAWSGQDINKTEFIDYLKICDIIPFTNIDDGVEIIAERKQARKEEKKRHKRELSPERKEALRLQMVSINANKQGGTV